MNDFQMLEAICMTKQQAHAVLRHLHDRIPDHVIQAGCETDDEDERERLRTSFRKIIMAIRRQAQ